MKLSFSTRGWENYSFEENVQTALTMSFDGVELYNPQKQEALIGRGGPFHKYGVAGTIRDLRSKGVQIPLIDTSCDLSAGAVEELKSLFQLAHDADIPYVSAVALSDHEDVVRSSIDELLPAAIAQKVTLLIKTSGIYADTSRLRSLMDEYAYDELAVLWDIHHPYRDFHESADTTIKNLGAYVCHVHLRDSLDDGSYEIIGEGTLPVADMMRALSSIDYDGFISLEWKPGYLEEVDDREIIFPHFLNYMNRFENTLG